MDQVRGGPGDEENGPWGTALPFQLLTQRDEVGATVLGQGSQLPEDCQRWVTHLRKRSNRRGATYRDGTVRKYLNSLSNLYARAVSERYVAVNPVRSHVQEAHGGAAGGFVS